MHNTLGILSLTIFLATGCGGRTNIAPIEADIETVSATDQITTDETLTGILAGATFVSVDPLDSDGTPPTVNRTLSFTSDEVTNNNIDGREVGSFSNIDGSASTDTSEWIANFASGSVNFSVDGNSILWDGISYQRVAASLFDSRQSLISFFDGSTYNTVGEFDIGENAFGQVALGNWSIQFADNQIVWSVQDTVTVGTYSFNDSGSFNIDLGFNELTAFVLNNDQLVIDSIVYQREGSTQFSSQQRLDAFLDGASYRSSGQLPVGENASGTQALGYWYLDFLSNTFNWAHDDITQAGTVTYRDENSFTAILANTETIVEVAGNNIVWEGESYIRQ